MMHVINGVMLAVSGSLAALIAVKATLAVALGLGAAWLARGSRAAVRHALLAGTFGVLLLLPIVSILAPPVRIAIPRAERVPPAPAFAVVSGSLAPARAGADSTPAPAQSAGVSLSALLLAVWAAGMALFLLPVTMGLRQVRSLRRSAVRWAHGQSAAEGLARETRIRRSIEVLLHEALPGPMTCGAVRPAIVLPVDAQTWDAEDLDRALVHELEHVRRGDWVTQCLARVVCAAYWFHPLVWIAWRQLKLEAERACDDAVLRSSEATAYADQLVGLARRLSTAAQPTLAMANHADLTARVSAMLDSRQRRGRAGALAVAAACAGAAALVMAISPLQVVAAAQSAGAGVTAKSGARLQTTTGLVVEAVTVTNSSGKAYEGLSAGDFTLTEDGVPQSISMFEFQKLNSQQDSASSYYILGYYTGNSKLDGAFRKIAITCKVTSATLRYRPGYFGNKSFIKLNGASSAVEENSVGQGSDPGVRPPRLISKVEPEYSDEARKAKFQGHVLLTVDVDASGKVTDAQVNRSLGLGLDQKAIEAVKQWKFTPGMKDGKPIAVQVEVGMDFRLL